MTNFEFINCDNGIVMIKPRRLVFCRMRRIRDAIQYCLWVDKRRLEEEKAK